MSDERKFAIRTESRLKIASSVPDVWAYLCDVGRWPEWAPTVLECWVAGGGPLQPGSRVEQRAKLTFGLSRHRSQKVTAVEAPRHLAFAGTMGSSPARWGMEFEPVDDGDTEAMMWVEVDLENVMRAIPGRVLKDRIQGVSDLEMVAIKAAVESAETRTQAPPADLPYVFSATRAILRTRPSRSQSLHCLWATSSSFNARCPICAVMAGTSAVNASINESATAR